MSLVSGFFHDLRTLFDFIDSEESFVSSRLKSNLDAREYKLINNILLPSSGNTPTTQIDHIVVSPYGVFVIETKSHQGWIFGSRKGEYWTQVLYRKKYKLYNPFRQNYAHVKAVENILGDEMVASPVSLVAFPSADKLFVDDTDNVGTTQHVADRIVSYKERLYTSDQVVRMIKVIKSHNMNSDAARRQHISEVSAYLNPAKSS